MKRKFLFSLSLFMFAALMAFNLQQVDKGLPDGLSSISLETLDIMPVTAQAEGGGDCSDFVGHCTPFGCEIVGIECCASLYGAPFWFWQYSGCNSTCNPFGSLCCFDLGESDCDPY